ncbi:MAG: ABC transporter permease subunit [Vallitaleaceae bacterium]|nr:ABC transporter permease subunit [Vallitaleaceae bacterium]
MNKVNKKYLIISLVLVLLIATSFIGNILLQDHNDIIQTKNIDTGVGNYRLLYSENEKTLLIGTLNGSVIAYDGNDQMIWEFSTNNVISDLIVTESQQQVIVGSEDRNIYILDIKTGQVLNTINVQRPIYSLDYNSENKFIVVASGLSSMKNNLLLYTIDGEMVWNNKLGINCQKVIFSNDGKSILLGNDRGEVSVYDLQGQLISKQKFDAPIIEMKMLQDQSLNILTEAGTIFKTTLSFEKMLKIDNNGEGKSLDIITPQNINVIGLAQGDVLAYDEKGEFTYKYYFDKVIFDILSTTDVTFIVAGDGDIYYFENRNLETIIFTTQLERALKVLFLFLVGCLLISCALTFTVLKNSAIRFGKMIFKHRVAYLMLIPTFLLLIVFCYIPVFTAFIRAFTDWNMQDDKIRFVGLDNFVKMFNEGYFLMGVKNLAILTLTSFLKILSVPLLVAELIFNMRGSRSKYWFRFLFVLPMVVPAIVGVLMWQNIYDPTIGLVNNLLELVGRADLQRVWLGDENTAIWSIVFMGFPFVDAFAFLIYYGGLINIPTDVFESARVEGANGWNVFWKIKIPLIMPQVKMLIILNFIAQIQNFMPVLILTGGGPGYSTYVPGLELYYNATRFGKYGYACALGVVMFIFIFAGTLLNMRIQSSKDADND